MPYPTVLPSIQGENLDPLAPASAVKLRCQHLYFTAWTLYLLSRYDNVYSKQLKLNAFWVMKNRSKNLPGSIQSPDRFMRGCSYTMHQKNGVYYFDSALSPQMVWLNLRQLDFSPGSGIRAIAIETNPSLQGNLNAQLRPGTAIRFLAPKS